VTRERLDRQIARLKALVERRVKRMDLVVEQNQLIGRSDHRHELLVDAHKRQDLPQGADVSAESVGQVGHRLTSEAATLPSVAQEVNETEAMINRNFHLLTKGGRIVARYRWRCAARRTLAPRHQLKLLCSK
jgi:hypothetical protein